MKGSEAFDCILSPCKVEDLSNFHAKPWLKKETVSGCSWGKYAGRCELRSWSVFSSLQQQLTHWLTYTVCLMATSGPQQVTGSSTRTHGNGDSLLRVPLMPRTFVLICWVDDLHLLFHTSYEWRGKFYRWDVHTALTLVYIQCWNTPIQWWKMYPDPLLTLSESTNTTM